MKFTKGSGFLAAAFLGAALMITGCGTEDDHTLPIENTLHGDHNTSISSDGIFYVFDFKEKTAQYVVHDYDGWSVSHAVYKSDATAIDQAPEVVQSNYQTSYEMTAYNRSGNVDGAVWQVTSLDHGLDNYNVADLLMLDPVSMKVFVINTKVDLDNSNDKKHNGVVYDPEDLPEYLVPAYEAQLKAYGLDKDASIDLEDLDPKPLTPSSP